MNRLHDLHNLLHAHQLTATTVYAIIVIFVSVFTITEILDDPADSYKEQTQVRRYSYNLSCLALTSVLLGLEWAFVNSPIGTYRAVNELLAGGPIIDYLYEVLVIAALCAPLVMLFVLAMIYVFYAELAKYDAEGNYVTTVEVRLLRRDKRAARHEKRMQRHDEINTDRDAPLFP